MNKESTVEKIALGFISGLLCCYVIFAPMGEKPIEEVTVVEKEYVTVTRIVTATSTPAPTDAPSPTPTILIQEESIPTIKIITPTPTLAAAPTKAPTSTPSAISEDDRILLAKLVASEAGDQDLKGKALVAAVVMNRVKSKSWPNSISGVIFQKGQFAVVANGRIWTTKVDKECYKAVDMVIYENWDESQGAMYFRMKSTDHTLWHYSALKYLFGHQDHDFFK